LTQLSEIHQRLTSSYAERLGVPVTVYKDSNPVPESDWNAREARIQLTAVEPCIPGQEVGQKRSAGHYARHADVQSFVFETPFTMGGKAHAGAVTEQFKRKTVVHVEQKMPSLLKRLPVVDRYGGVTVCHVISHSSAHSHDVFACLAGAVWSRCCRPLSA